MEERNTQNTEIREAIKQLADSLGFTSYRILGERFVEVHVGDKRSKEAKTFIGKLCTMGGYPMDLSTECYSRPLIITF